VLFLLLTAAALYWGIDQCRAQSTDSSPSSRLDAYLNKYRITQAEREAAAERAAALRKQAQAAPALDSSGITLANPQAVPAFPPVPGGVPDYFGMYPNWAYSPTTIRKFVNTLPGLGSANQNEIGQYIPIATADTTTYSGSDYYTIGLTDYIEQLHSDLPATKLRGYQDLTPVPGADHTPQYLGPLIIATKDRPVRILFKNNLGHVPDGNLFLPVDTTMMGAGTGPLSPTELYTQNRAVLHLHGGATPWISDGTPHQWITPAGETTSYVQGASQQNVPDMTPIPSPGDGTATYYYTNQQGGRLMFYHDHSLGMTRLNVYAGEAAGYLLKDPVEDGLIDTGKIPGLGAGVYRYGIPLIIQDKTFVDATTILQTDPTWNWGTGTPVGGIRPPVTGDLWFPHVYMTNQNPADVSGANAMGRWDYGPWFWPPVTTLAHMPIPNPYASLLGEPPEIPAIPNPSLVPEAFMDTPLVNGTPYPKLTVDRKAYRFRILNACNDRMLNLQLYYVDPAHPTEVKMVPAASGAGLPDTWPTDGRDGGAPDPATDGPAMIQIGTEGGFLPAPVVLPNTPIGYNYNRRDIVVLNVSTHTLLLGPAERGDVIIDFSQVPAGSKIILYNDAPAPVPAFDSRLDYYTGDPDQTSTGGAATTLEGYGPNTRTIMRFEVSGGNAGSAFDLAGLKTAWPAAYTAAQLEPIVPQTAYPSSYAGTTDTYSRIQSTSLTFTQLGALAPVTQPLEPKAIQELFELNYGRMNATLGVELPFTNFNTQTTLPFGYIDPPTEILHDGEVQIWKITHNGVDTHPVHFHLVNVQVINRVGWDGAIRPPDPNELGWKETVRMNPLEDCIVAMKPVAPTVPFSVPDSVRPYNVTAPIGDTSGFANLDPATGNPITVTNQLFNFGWEYVWHCHILGHEENDFMRPVVFLVPTTAPDAPTTLTATPAIDAITNVVRVDLAWSDLSNNEAGFRIERSPAGAGTFQLLANAPANSTSFTDTMVEPQTAYDYHVRAYNSKGPSAWSNIASATTADGAPLAASSLTATAISSTRIDLAWTNHATNATGIRIERALGQGPFSQLMTVTPGTAAYSDTAVAPETTYRYRIIAYKSAFDAQPSNIATATTLPNPPTAPTGLTATAINASRVDLVWTNTATNATGIIIERAVGAGAFSQLATVTATTTAYSDTTTVALTTYYYRVIATNAGGNSAPSNPATATTPPYPPSAPASLTATAINSSRVDLGWVDTSNNETGFIIERAVGAGAFSTLTTVAANTVTYSDTTVVEVTTYTYRVTATNAGGNSAPSNTAQATTPAFVSPPSAPTGLTAMASSTGQVDLAWTDTSANETGFIIERAVGGGAFSQLTTVGVNTVTYSDTKVAAATTYTYRVTATNTGGNSAPSNTATATTPASITAPSAPTGLTATASSTGQVDLAWTDTSNNETYFIIERATGAGAFSQLATVGANTVSYSDTTVAAATTYSYRVTATNTGGNSAPSNTATATTSGIGPAAPASLTVSVGGQTELDLSWADQSNNEDGFRIERSDGGAFAAIGTVAANTTVYSDTTLGPATTYTYRVIAFNAIGDSAPSNTASGTTLDATAAPAGPTGLTASVSVASSLQVTLNWLDNSDNEGGFTIQRSTNVFFLGALATYSVGPNVTTYTDTAVAIKTTYFYRVRATNNIGNSAFSNTANVRTPRNVLPAAPTNLQVTGAVRSFLTLSWIDNAANEQGFYIERSTAGADGPWTRLAALRAKLAAAPSSVTYMNFFLARGTTYWYRVQAHNSAGGSAYSNVVSGTTLP